MGLFATVYSCLSFLLQMDLLLKAQLNAPSSLKSDLYPQQVVTSAPLTFDPCPSTALTTQPESLVGP